MQTQTATPVQRIYEGACSIDHKTGRAHLYALSVYSCPNGHAPFYSYAVNGAVSWGCPDCKTSGEYIGCDGEAHTFLRRPRPVMGRHVRNQLGLLQLPETQEYALKLIQLGTNRYEWTRCEQHEQQYQRALDEADQ